MAVTQLRTRLLALLRERSYTRRTVVLSSGHPSDFFIDCKQAVLSAEGHALVGEVLFGALGQVPACAAVAGVELGGCSLASAVSLFSYQQGDAKDAIYVRKDAKAHGSRRLLEGNDRFEKGTSIVLLEDVVSTGGSTLRAALKLRDAGFTVRGVVALVDRLEGGRDALEADGLSFVSIFTRDDFFTS